MRLTKAFFVLPLMLLISLAAGAPDEAMGRVSKVVDGDIVDVTLESHDGCGMTDRAGQKISSPTPYPEPFHLATVWRIHLSSQRNNIKLLL